ncbi:hypothetical protein [Shewanella sp. MBTL60-007]|uniref:hypothetical protein n=1 Tax=Shewanella sp. MBTL60-007 TaxID=2815911 RepID=UPI001C7E25C8|nr:hypothetical protein [Shewanella sp. MBTL60-007]
MTGSKFELYRSKGMLLLFVIVSLNALFFFSKDIIAYYYMFYSSDYTGDKKTIIFPSESGETESLELNEQFFVTAGELQAKYLVFGGWEYGNGLIRIDAINFNKWKLLDNLSSEQYIQDVYRSDECSVFKFIKPFDGADYEYIAVLSGVKAIFSFDSTHELRGGVPEICDIFKR